MSKEAKDLILISAYAALVLIAALYLEYHYGIIGI